MKIFIRLVFVCQSMVVFREAYVFVICLLIDLFFEIICGQPFVFLVMIISTLLN
jgi:ABC-type microcin C transport system permease subunit YejE